MLLSTTRAADSIAPRIPPGRDKGNREWGMGDGEWEVGSWKREVGSGNVDATLVLH